MAAAGLWRSSSSLRPSPADSPLIDSGGVRRGRRRGPGAEPGRCERGDSPPPSACLRRRRRLSTPSPSGLAADLPGPGRWGRPLSSPLPGRCSPPLCFCLLGPWCVLSRRASRGVLPAGPPYSQTCCLRISRPLLSSRRPPLKSAP